ncbi:hypothetical protein ODJ79_17515 [Actinoplanes sp. KI2]|uniref:hypothetical protein n=1 Tax=Actinoplanes sp. KI2 TaxID=2983315 RepID=UPI0021D5DA35|nr:hypothetical protein [Actinoplanes sp. KI2]MCU7725529.1 hypothetical protein [Actinoplanes sp. KI2]
MVILLLLLLIGVGASVFLAGGRRGTVNERVLADTRAEALRWYERLGGQLLDLRDDGGAARQALTDAAERYQAAGAQISRARTVMQYQLARETTLEGLAYVRAARLALGIEPGPELPPLASARAGVIDQEQEINGYRVGPRATAQTPYYYAGGYVNGRPVPAGYYATPWWKTALAAGAGTIGGMLIMDTLFGHHQGDFPQF